MDTHIHTHTYTHVYTHKQKTHTNIHTYTYIHVQTLTQHCQDSKLYYKVLLFEWLVKTMLESYSIITIHYLSFIVACCSKGFSFHPDISFG